MSRRPRRARPQSARRPGRRARLWPRLRRVVVIAALVCLLGPPLLIVGFRFVDPPVTPLMLIRVAEGHERRQDWVPARAISRHLAYAVIAAEDNRFCEHGGMDWQAMADAWQEWRAGGRLRGASTITMQTAKNLFLWPDRNWVRKGLEAWLTLQIEFLWPKERILEVYLNIAEWGPGIYGAQAAAQHHFGRDAGALTVGQAALLAAALPNPLARAAGRPSASHTRQANRIAQRIPAIQPLLACADRAVANE